ncbi:hypothetical protein LOTGIDRAFT_131218 [Lottia gigantea]|uniref:Tektin n=1 Tax=Lottia gigantea TaxID=225164 RepID=V3Z2W8_LOTGI|nr:hypothetical protein LOTGIDRAFT_131218 [Lottia gigantea]ESO84948.1 hypothetical protein LOTGIDRAFT_131218 [Lottia gigantea]
MDYMGYTKTATYMGGPRQSSNILPSIMQSSYKPFDTYPAPSPLRRSLTTAPWRPSTYYQSGQTSPAHALSRSLQGVNVPPVFAASRNALYTRYTPNDWSSSNQTNYMSSDKVRSGAERVRFDTVRLCRETDDKTKRTQTDVGKRLGERIGDITFWKTELNHEIDNVIAETNALNEAKRVLEKALAETENPLHVAQECLYHREKRQEIDLVHDNPEKELIKEVEIIKRCQHKMRDVINKAEVQIGLNRAAQHELEKDSSDKFRAQTLDETCHGMRNASRGLAFHNGVHRIDNTLSVPESWAKFTNDNIQRSQSERAASKHMRNEIESTINSSANDMWTEWNAVNVALNGRMNESVDVRNKLQTHLSKVLQEIFDMDRNIELLKKAIQDKTQPMQVAQSRLDTRIRRPNVELCRDPVQHRLVSEVSEISDTVDALQAKLRHSENTLQELLRTKSALEHDLSIKNNSVFIDREKCLGMRKTFPMAPRNVLF